MDPASLPKLNRELSKPAIFLIRVYVKVILKPMTWILKKTGFDKKVLIKSGKSQMGPGGAEKVFTDYKPTSHDIFVSTFAKSGTNWMMQIAHQIAFYGEGEFDHIHDVIAWPDYGGFMKHKLSIPIQDTRVQQASPSQLRVIKTHLGINHVPYEETSHYLTVVRDPKEIFVSSFYFGQESFGPLMTDVDTWLELFLSKDFPFNFGSTWAEHTAGYWALREKSNVLILTYQEMKKDLPASVLIIANNLGIHLNDLQLDQVVEKSSFSYMSNINHKFQPFPNGTIPWQDDFKMIRAGESGNSGELISVEQQIRIDEYFQHELKMLNSDFPYTLLFKIADLSSEQTSNRS